MNTIHNNGENDKSLNEDLHRLGKAYGQLPHDEPPQLLDQAILNSAHRAVENKPHWMKFGWLHGLTTAAVFVLALSLVINQREPVPVFENGMQDNEVIGSGRETAAKIHAPSTRSIDDHAEMKAKSENRRDVLQGAPVSATTPSEPLEITAGDRAAEPAAGIQYSTYVQDGLRAKEDTVDTDAKSDGRALEEQLADEVDLPVDAAEAEMVAKQSLPAPVAERATGEAHPATEADSEIEKKLLAIIRLKQSGDKTWMTELELFKQNYPGYPLPAELSD